MAFTIVEAVYKKGLVTESKRKRNENKGIGIKVEIPAFQTDPSDLMAQDESHARQSARIGRPFTLREWKTAKTARLLPGGCLEGIGESRFWKGKRSCFVRQLK